MCSSRGYRQGSGLRDLTGFGVRRVRVRDIRDEGTRFTESKKRIRAGERV